MSNDVTARGISFASADSTIAVVDATGNVTGVGPGTTYITTAYNGLLAAQTVEVIGIPTPPTRLIHRYSFSDGTANDSVGRDETGFDFNNLLGQAHVHLVAVFNPTPGRQFLGLYLNGTLISSVPTGNKSITSIDDAYSFLGRSLYSADAWLAGSIDEFRIYDGELHPDQVAATQMLGANQVLSTAPPFLNAMLSSAGLTLSWPLVSAGAKLQAGPALSPGSWTTLSNAAQIIGNQWQLTLPITGTAQFYRLKL